MLKSVLKTYTGKTIWAVGVLAMAAATSGFAQNSRLKVKLTPSISSPAPVGQQVMWTATVAGGSGRLTYRFLTGPVGTLNVVRDFSPVNTLPWSELTEGTYHILVEVRDISGATGQIGAAFTFHSRITGTTPVVSGMANPLLALYSAPPCPSGSTVLVKFWPSNAAKDVTKTPAQNCNGATSLNFYVAGMLASTPYIIQQITTTGTTNTPGPEMTFTTGAVGYNILPFKENIQPSAATSKAESVLLMSFKALKANPPLYPPTAVDLHGNVLWYYYDPESPKTPLSEYVTRPVNGGTFLLLMWGGAIREVDLAGNIVRETNVLRIAEQLKAKGTDQIAWLSHEALRLPNGHTVTLGSAERILNNVQGSTGQVDVVGDLIIDLDENFQVSWSWSSFDFLNTERRAPLDEKCGVKQGGGGDSCGHLKLASIANDWTHANSLLITPDNNLLFSTRDQDYIIKIDYNNGAGDGHVIWALGDPENGCVTPGCIAPTFTMNPPGTFYQSTWPWFSHQHDIEFDGTNYELYDNGNTRVAPAPLGLGSGNSRGYVFSLDETKMTISVVQGYDLGNFDPGFGSAQLLSNGDYTFTNGTINDGLNSQVLEFEPNGKIDFGGVWKSRSYRSFRLTNLYTYTQ